jgi:DNA-binding GntR family transcriptional regulator
MHLEIDRPPSLTAVTAKAIADAILTGQFSPGQRLLELELANDLKISRAPLREALRQLASEGLLEIRPNRGTFVVDPSPEEIVQMSVTRALIEGSAARLVAYKRNQEAIGRLNGIMDALLEADAIGDRNAIFRHHWDFHRAVCEESGNPYLLKAWSSASSIIRIYYRMQIESDIVKANKAFMKALEEGDPEDAEGLFRSQIICTAFRVMNLPVPDEIAGYLTHSNL